MANKRRQKIALVSNILIQIENILFVLAMTPCVDWA
jgi:hypothetical protein